jgi:hypothetical protein
MKDLIYKVKGDLLPIMLPGMFLLFGIYVCLSIHTSDISKFFQYLILNTAETESDQKTNTESKDDKINTTQQIERNYEKNIESGVTILFIFFLVYLIGQALRAIPVAITEKCCKQLHCNLICSQDERKCNEIKLCRKNEGLAKYYYYKNEKFPYSRALNEILKKLDNSEEIVSYSFSNLFSPENIDDNDLYYIYFNLFKVSLCAESANTFLYTQKFEERVRLFAGLFWAGIINFILVNISILPNHLLIIPNLLIFICLIFLNISWKQINSWILLCAYIVSLLIASCYISYPFLGFLIIILSLLLIIIYQFSWIRGQEVFHVFLSYLSLLIHRKNQNVDFQNLVNQLSRMLQTIDRNN